MALLKKEMYKFMVRCLTVSVLAGSVAITPTSVYGQTQSDNNPSIGNTVPVYVNDTMLSAVAILTENGEYELPIRSILEALGHNYIDGEKTILVYGTISMFISPGHDQISYNNQIYDLTDSIPYKDSNDELYSTGKQILAFLGKEMVYDSVANTISIVNIGESATPSEPVVNNSVDTVDASIISVYSSGVLQQVVGQVENFFIKTSNAQSTSLTKTNYKIPSEFNSIIVDGVTKIISSENLFRENGATYINKEGLIELFGDKVTFSTTESANSFSFYINGNLCSYNKDTHTFYSVINYFGLDQNTTFTVSCNDDAYTSSKGVTWIPLESLINNPGYSTSMTSNMFSILTPLDRATTQSIGESITGETYTYTSNATAPSESTSNTTSNNSSSSVASSMITTYSDEGNAQYVTSFQQITSMEDYYYHKNYTANPTTSDEWAEMAQVLHNTPTVNLVDIQPLSYYGITTNLTSGIYPLEQLDTILPSDIKYITYWDFNIDDFTVIRDNPIYVGEKYVFVHNNYVYTVQVPSDAIPVHPNGDCRYGYRDESIEELYINAVNAFRQANSAYQWDTLTDIAKNAYTSSGVTGSNILTYDGTINDIIDRGTISTAEQHSSFFIDISINPSYSEACDIASASSFHTDNCTSGVFYREITTNQIGFSNLLSLHNVTNTYLTSTGHGGVLMGITNTVADTNIVIRPSGQTYICTTM